LVTWISRHDEKHFHLGRIHRRLADAFEVGPKSGIGDFHAIAVIDIYRVARKRREDSERHGYAVISLGDHLSGKKFPAGTHNESIGQLTRIGADSLQVADNGRDSVALL